MNKQMTFIEKIKCFIAGTYPHSWLEDEEENRDHEASPLKKEPIKEKKGS